MYYSLLLSQVVLGKTVCSPTVLDKDLAEDLLRTQKDFTYDTVLGRTMCTDDFYEGFLGKKLSVYYSP